jgi:hypothetical protein
MDDDQELEQEQDSHALREARAAAQRNAEEAARIPDLERENAFLRALPGGLTESPLGEVFVAGYRGELTPEAIRESAAKIGLLQPEPGEGPPQAGEANELDETLQQTREALRVGAVPPVTEDAAEAARLAAEHPADAGLKAFRASMDEGTPREDAAAQMYDRLIAAAVRGDERVIWTKEKQQELAGAPMQGPRP